MEPEPQNRARLEIRASALKWLPCINNKPQPQQWPPLPCAMFTFCKKIEPLQADLAWGDVMAPQALLKVVLLIQGFIN